MKMPEIMTFGDKSYRLTKNASGDFDCPNCDIAQKSENCVFYCDIGYNYKLIEQESDHERT